MPNNERKGKWQPFDALEGYRQSIKNANYEKEKKPKPILLPDQLEELNLKITLAMEDKVDVILTYYKNGYNFQIKGIITKVDLYSKEVIIDSLRIPLASIQSID